MDEGAGFGRTQVHFEGLCGQTLAHAFGGGPDECPAVGTGRVIPMLLEKQSCLLRQEEAGRYTERRLCADGYFW